MDLPNDAAKKLVLGPLRCPQTGGLLLRVSRKSAKIAALLEDVPKVGVPPHYAGYFACFNRGLYYEAHEVLEELWLPVRRERDGDFYKGLIQLAGAFVHLQKNRLRPADALFALAAMNLGKFPARHLGLDVAEVRRLIAEWRARLAAGAFSVNPLNSPPLPQLDLPEPF